MNDYLLSVILGVVEGLTEFLPVSSTAHLRMTEALLHLDLGSAYWKMYTIVIQLGAILTLPIYFRERIAKFLATFPKGERGDRTVVTHPLSLVLIAFVVTALPAFLMTKIIGKHLESLTIIGSALLIGGIVMWFVDARNAKAEKAGEKAGGGGLIKIWHMEDMSLGQAVWIGACQILSAVFPGTSRSMSTIAAGQLAGMSRASALEFSFFLSIPTMVVATCYDLLKSVMGKHSDAISVAHIDGHGWVVLGIGFAVSFVVAYGSVAWFMGYVRKRGFAPFAIYRIVLGVAVLYFASRMG
ncbi:MAG TPA: undecaprenyl-diphosphate phosphatase [Candidatus Acidoferrum sp.]|nr:undecaprenyl-diphosphate phosphatase [Candidatus Acidoferrum sp.]